jgi:integrase
MTLLVSTYQLPTLGFSCQSVISLPLTSIRLQVSKPSRQYFLTVKWLIPVFHYREPPKTQTQGQSTHIRRHTFASHFIANGGNILTLQKILEHSDLKITMRYAHLAPDHLKDVLEFNLVVKMWLNSKKYTA